MMATKGFSFTAAPDLAAQQMAMDRQRKIAEMLQQQAVTPDQGQTVQGGIYVAPHWTQGASKLAQALLSNKMNSDLDGRQVALGQEQAKRMSAALKGLAPAGTFDDVAPPTTPGQLGSGMMDAVTPTNGAPVVPQVPKQDDATRQAWARALSAMQINPELGGKLIENLSTLTGEQKNMAAMGQDPRLMGALATAKARSDGIMKMDPNATYLDLTTNQRQVAPDFKTGIAGGYGPNGAPQMSRIAGSEIIPQIAGETKAAEARATNANTIAPLDIIKNPDGTFTPRTVGQVVDAALPSSATRYQGQDLIEQLPPDVRAGILAQERKVGNSQFDLNYQMPDGRVIAGKVDLSAANNAATQPTTAVSGQSTLDAKFQSELGGNMAKTLTEGQSKAEELREGVAAIDKSLGLIQSGAFLGAGADLKTDAAKILNDNFGTNISPDKVANTDFLRSTLGMPLLTKAKALGYNPTDADAKRLDVILGTISKNPAALPELLQFNREVMIKAIETHNKKAQGVKGPYSLTVEVPGAYAPIELIATQPQTPASNVYDEFGLKRRK